MVARFWWIIHKDLVSEFRARRVWPVMLLMGVVVALVFSLQMDLLPDQRQCIVGGLLWLAVFFAGMTAIDRSFASEHEEGCWEGLKLMPVSPETMFLAKMTVNVIALSVLECLVVPLFFVLSDLPLWTHAGGVLLIAVVANLGMAAVGTLVSALAAGSGKGGGLLLLLVLPLMIPVLLAASECTRLLIQGQSDTQWWRWMQLLIAFAVVYVTAGTVLFEYAIED